MINRDYELTKEEEEEFNNLILLRKGKMPIKYITKSCEFMGLDFFVKEGVLIPRPDTEILVEETIKIINHKGYKRICDVCCGSGAIGLSVGELCKDTKVDLLDISEYALEVSEINRKKLEVESNTKVYYSDLLSVCIENNEEFDCIISNPPYIREDVIPTLMEDVKDYEPELALVGGVDGLDFYRKITEQSLEVLKKGGLLAFEIGHDQKDEVTAILESNGYKNIKSYKDLAGHDRVVLGEL